MKTFQHYDPKTSQFVEDLKHINVDGSYYLLLLTGPYMKGKKTFIKNLSSNFDKKVTHIDMREIVTLDEEETRERIDSTIDSLSDDEYLIFFSNGDRLCGAYTGFTYSHTRYATPQERYLLSKLNKLEKIVMLDIKEEHNIDNTLRRYSHAEIQFQKPRSFFKRLTWNLGSVTFHGHEFTSKRISNSW